jgi:hypothetical protein
VDPVWTPPPLCKLKKKIKKPTPLNFIISSHEISTASRKKFNYKHLIHRLLWIWDIGVKHSAYKSILVEGRAIAQAVSRGLPTAAVGSSPGQVMWDLWWTKWHWGRLSPRIRFPLPIRIPPTAPHSSSIIRGWYNRINSDRSTKEDLNLSLSLWLYSPLDLGRFFSFLIYTQSVGLLGREISPS